MAMKKVSIKPVKPKIEAFEIQKNTCFTRANASLLFQYIIELEYRY